MFRQYTKQHRSHRFFGKLMHIIQKRELKYFRIRDIGTKNYKNSSTSEVAKMTRNLGNFCKHKDDGSPSVKCLKQTACQNSDRCRWKFQVIMFKSANEGVSILYLQRATHKKPLNFTIFIHHMRIYLVSLFDFLK